MATIRCVHRLHCTSYSIELKQFQKVLRNFPLGAPLGRFRTISPIEQQNKLINPNAKLNFDRGNSELQFNVSID